MLVHGMGGRKKQQQWPGNGGGGMAEPVLIINMSYKKKQKQKYNTPSAKFQQKQYNTGVFQNKLLASPKRQANTKNTRWGDIKCDINQQENKQNSAGKTNSSSNNCKDRQREGKWFSRNNLKKTNCFSDPTQFLLLPQAAEKQKQQSHRKSE